MRMYCVTVVLALVTVAMGAWGAQEALEKAPAAANPPAVRSPAPPTLPNLQSTTLSIPWQEFKALIEQIQPPRKVVKAPPTLPPPFEWTVASASYDAEAIGAGSVRVKATLNVTVLKPKGWVQVPVLGSQVAAVSAAVNGQETPLALEKDQWSTLLLDKPGEYTVDLEFFVHCVSEEGVVSFEFPCPRTPLTRMTLRVPVRDAVVRSPSAANVTVRADGDAMTADLVFPSTESIAVSWTLPAKVHPKAPVAARIEPRVTCIAATLVTLTEGYISCQSQLRYDVLRGEVDTFRMRLPNTVNVLDVVGQGAAWTATPAESDDPEATQLVEVKVNHKIPDRYEVVMTYEVPADDELATLTAPQLIVDDVVRPTGFVAVTARSNVEVKEGPEVPGLTRVDVTELPTGLRAMSPSPILLAYKYIVPDYMLSMDVRKLEDVYVRTASIERGFLTTMVTDDGTTVNRAVYEVRNNTKQFLRVALPEGSEVLSAEVGGQVVKPAQESEQDGVLIPLFKSVVTNQRLGTFPVELLFMGPKVAMAEESLPATFTLDAPTTDIPVNEVCWEVLVPENRQVYKTSGDLKRVEAGAKPRPYQGRRPATGAPVTRAALQSRQETSHLLREGVERFLITDINNPAASAGGKGNRYQGQPVKPSGAASGVAVAGVLPVRVDFPIEGLAHQFRRIIIAEGEPLSLTLHTRRADVVTAMKWLGTLLVLVSGLGVVQLVRVKVRRRRAARSAS
jgi:hypothetical protein